MTNPDIRETATTSELTNDELPPGTKLSNGAYTIVEHLKTGGFGITYLATDTFGRRVVIKECFPGGICNRVSRAVRARSRIYVPNVTGLIEKFVVEAHSLAKLNHPNIVKVHQVFKENETAYMALDYVEGHDLLDVMAHSSRALTPAGVRTTLLRLLDAVAAVHEKGLLHRDISPDNILIDSKRNPILIDFGAAREQDRSAESAASTLHVVKDGYSPQELYLSGGGDQGAWSDLYSLAASFYHVIAGEAPANSQERLAAMASNSSDPCVPLVGRFEGYDNEFLAAIDKAMSVLPKERMQTASHWIGAITGTDGDKVVRMPVAEPSRLVTPMTRVTRMEAEAGRKKIGPIALIGGLAVLSFVAVGVYLAMPDGNSATVEGLPADVAAAGVPAVGKASAAATASSTAPAAPAVKVAAAEPVAPVEPPAVVKPEVEVQPVTTPVVAETSGASSDVAALTTNWTIELPFAADEGQPNVVATTNATVPEWLVPGLQIAAVNGTAVSRIDEMSAILRQSQNPGDAPAIATTLTTVGAEGQVDRSLDLPVVHRVVMVSGAEFLVRSVDGMWRTEVSVLPAGYSGEMRIGDVIVGHVKSGSRISGPMALKDALEADIIAGNRSTTLAIQQGGQMWVVTFPLPG